MILLESSKLEILLEDILSRQGAQSAVDSLGILVGAFVLTLDGRVVAVDSKFSKMLGYEHGELEGMEAINLVADEFQTELRWRLRKDQVERYNLKLLTKSGGIKSVVVSPRIIRSDGVKYRLAEFVDYTDQVASEYGRLEVFQNIASALTHTIERRDPYTKGHMSRTAHLAVTIAEQLGLDKAAIDLIELGANLHDIGKVSVPIEIMIKPTKLEPHEWAFIEMHPVIGHEILSDINFNKTVTDIVLHHHERQDGSGYPNQLSGDEIPIETAIVSVADCLDSIAGVRPYRKAYSFAEAIEILKAEGPKHRTDVLSVAIDIVESGLIQGKEFSPDI